MAIRHKTAMIFGCLLLILPEVAAGDIIYFKDGMRTVCSDRAWEEGDEVKCEYEGVILIYRKVDVDHIQQITPLQTAPDPAASSRDSDEGSLPSQEIDAGLSPASGGPLFYDPRRPFKFWSSPTSKHATYREAVDALAAEFNRPAEAVEAQIGNSNDLDQIRARLSGSPGASTPEAAVSVPEQSRSGTEFYDPRREFKYWTSDAAKHRTYREAIDALAREYRRPPEWIEAHMGTENDLGVIHENLRRAAAEAGDP